MSSSENHSKSGALNGSYGSHENSLPPADLLRRRPPLQAHEGIWFPRQVNNYQHGLVSRRNLPFFHETSTTSQPNSNNISEVQAKSDTDKTQEHESPTPSNRKNQNAAPRPETHVRLSDIELELVAKTKGPWACSNCGKELASDQPRVSCIECRDYCSCSDCHLSGRVSGVHTTMHRFTIVKPSRKPLKILRHTPDMNKKVAEHPRGPSRQIAFLAEATNPRKWNEPTKDSIIAPAGKSSPGAGATGHHTKQAMGAIPDKHLYWETISRDTSSYDAMLRLISLTIFDYIDNMYEPFGAGKLTPEKLIHSRCFWLPPETKTAIFKKLNYDTGRRDNLRYWADLAVFFARQS